MSRSLSRRLAFILTLLSAIAMPLRAQSADAATRLAGRLDEETRASILALVDSARAAGLPADPLVSLALEGASKGASGMRVVAAVRTLGRELAAARRALGPTVGDAEVAAGAAVLHVGVQPVELAKLRKAHGARSLTVPLGVMADLVARGVPTDTATMAVLALARTRLTDDDLLAFRRQVERDIALGAPPAAAAAVRVSGAGAVGSTGIAAPSGAAPRP